MTEKTFARGEARRISIDIIEANLEQPLDAIAALVGEALGMDVKVARGHVRWLVREGYINDKNEITKTWPKRAPRRRAESTEKNKPANVEKIDEAKASTETHADALENAESEKSASALLIELVNKRKAEAQQASGA